MGADGLVASPHYLASSAGCMILDRGGSAVDAAIAMNAVLAVVAPATCGLGGDAMWLIHEGRTGEIHGLNGSGWAGSRPASADDVLSASNVTVPGAIDSWEKAHSRYGELSWQSLFLPAIALSRKGTAVSPSLARSVESSIDALGKSSEASSLFLPNGSPVVPGDALRQKELGASLELIAEEGARAMYEGRLAARIIEALGPGSGLTSQDFASFHSQWVKPISGAFRDCNVVQLPANSQGGAALVALKAIEGAAPAPFSLGSPEGAVLFIRACLEGIRARSSWGDPRFASAGSTAGGELRFAPHGETDTVAVVVLDRHGNAVALLQSNYFLFGTGIFVGGFFLHNRGAYFDPTGPNAWEPGKRPITTLMPGMVTRDGRLVGLMGTMGADGQFQTQVQLLLRVLDDCCSVQEAIEQPRLLVGRFLRNEAQGAAYVETASDEAADIIKAIEGAAGTPVKLIPRWDDRVGHAQMLWSLGHDGLWEAGTDPRADGLALAMVEG